MDISLMLGAEVLVPEQIFASKIVPAWPEYLTTKRLLASDQHKLTGDHVEYSVTDDVQTGSASNGPVQFGFARFVDHLVKPIRTSVSPSPHIALRIGVYEVKVINGYIHVPITVSSENTALKPANDVECQIRNFIRVAENANIIIFKISDELVAIAVCGCCQSKRRHYQ